MSTTFGILKEKCYCAVILIKVPSVAGASSITLMLAARKGRRPMQRLKPHTSTNEFGQCRLVR